MSALTPSALSSATDDTGLAPFVLNHTPKNDERFVEVLVQAFFQQSFNDAYVREDEKLRDDAEVTADLCRGHFRKAVEYWGRYRDYLLLESRNYSAVAVLVVGPCVSAKPEAHSFNRFSDALHAKHGLTGVYCLKIIGRHPQGERRGTIRGLLNYIKVLSARDGKICTLEAVTDTARAVYEYFGWQAVEATEWNAQPFTLMAYYPPSVNPPLLAVSYAKPPATQTRLTTADEGPTSEPFSQ
ncbi:hypothetical protein GNI_023840 [Gregarina niphandrodes]|uniref:N-acetyltransferase domain-containing protein n=1 Tax=Gregarina niphandrodes TaxID=110365 RepID=A0A023BBT0_GRENI|nr:hypothetical protein GNI_023840 [Gregarina niphandrodes]EZG79924.1 hypothetical protein GNI_023840 [Gregarina niphandrodes]|eukprot:XP_011134369.1 hypothetical protein GNI_023840 [Gregarina niphandrodes]